MGSVIEGEDIVQDTLTKVLTVAENAPDLTTPRGWLFRVAHNRAMDVLRSRAVRATEPIDMAFNLADQDVLDPEEQIMRDEAIAMAVSRFADLPVRQRAVVVLKDVLGESLADIAALLDLSVDAVKAHLARGRSGLREISRIAEARPVDPPVSDDVARYVALFNRRDWSSLRALLADDVRLNQATHPPRKGAANVGMFFGTYAKIDGVWLQPARLEGREVIAVFEGRAAARLAYIMWLEWVDGQITSIRDYRYTRYILDGADLELLPEPPG
jgi:RNA polymerase sigma-70 factor (ECF subfamily)